MSKLRHLLGISGGKDSTGLAIYLQRKYPELEMEYYFCDTGKELPETYELLNNLENFLGKKIVKLEAVENSALLPFDHFIIKYGGYIPSSNARWCTKNLKLEPFEKFVGDDPVISYVGIRGDEDREGYISKRQNIQSIFPFRKCIWSEDVISKVLNNNNIDVLVDLYKKSFRETQINNIINVLKKPLSFEFNQDKKLKLLLDFEISMFNKVVILFLKSTEYPLSVVDDFALINNTEVLMLDDIFRLLKESGIGIPKYYDKIEFEINGKKGFYNRSRSGCFFCFYQQKIEWIWLYENHNNLFKEAMKYEKEGYTWMPDESLSDIIKNERIKQIKENHFKKINSPSSKKSDLLLDIILDDENDGCAACFM